jgi:hypothetical protein
MQNGDALTEAERDVRDLEQYVADQRARIAGLRAAGIGDEELKAQEGLFLLSDGSRHCPAAMRAMRTELRERADRK